MSGTFQLFNLSGVGVRVHFSWIFIFAMLAWTLGNLYFPWRYPDWDPRLHWAAAIMCAPALFPCALLHQFGHALAALRRNIMVNGMTVLFTGGFCDLEREPRDALEELRISIGGPMTSAFWCVAYGSVALIARLFAILEPVAAIFEYLALINLFLALVNLIPASPLAGGRVLRALVWRTTGSEAKGTRAANGAGYGLGFGLMAAGIFFVFTGDLFAGVWLVFTGWFIQSAASYTRKVAVERKIATGRKVREAMSEGVRVVTPGTSVQSLVENHAAAHFERAYAVTLGDTLQGLVTLTDVARAPAERRPTLWVSEIMTRAPDLITIAPDAPLEDGLDIFTASDIKQIVVMEDGKPVGLLTREGVIRVMEVALLLPLQVEDDEDDEAEGRG